LITRQRTILLYRQKFTYILILSKMFELESMEYDQYTKLAAHLPWWVKRKTRILRGLVMNKSTDIRHCILKFYKRTYRRMKERKHVLGLMGAHCVKWLSWISWYQPPTVPSPVKTLEFQLGSTQSVILGTTRNLLL
jgi:hypothetical protein